MILCDPEGSLACCLGSHVSCHPPAGTVAYMAPEVLQMGSLSMAADVYSFAMIMLELWTGEAIYKDLPAHQVCCRPCLACNSVINHNFRRSVKPQSRLMLELSAIEAIHRGFSAL